MATAKGYKSKLAYKRESSTSTWGTPASVSLMLPFTSEGLQKQKEKIKDEYLSGIAGYELAETTRISANGSISLDMVYTGLEELFLCTLGHEQWHSVVDLGNGFYEHIIEPDYDLSTHPYLAGDGLLPGDITAGEKKVRRFTAVVDKQVSQHQFVSCFVNSLTISGQAGENIKLDAELLCYDRNLTTIDSSTWILPDGKFRRVLFSDMTFKVDGIVVNISEFNLQINNNLTQTQVNSLYLDEPIRNGKREVSFSFKIPRYEVDDFLSKVDTDTASNISLEFISSEGYEIGIYLPKIVWARDNVNVSGQELVSQGFELISLAGGSVSIPSGRKPEIYFRLVNKISTELWRL